MQTLFGVLRPSFERALRAGVLGDVAEFGVYRAGTFLPMAGCAQRAGRRAHAVDSFQGLAEPTDKDWKAGEHGQKAYDKGRFNVGGSGELYACLRDLCLDWAVVHEGWIPEVLSELATCRFAFVHLDLDHYQPTLDVLRFVWPRLSPGGVLFGHDYYPGRTGGATQAYDEWMLESGVKLEPFEPTFHCTAVKD